MEAANTIPFTIGRSGGQLSCCRGIRGRCRYSLNGTLDLPGTIIQALDRCGSIDRHRESPARALPHRQLKIALAACPNACTMPQVKDIGIIVRRFPQSLLPSCTACGQCVSVCREEAVTMTEKSPRWKPHACLGCGMCMSVCPQKAVEARPIQLKVLVGGRMGRHPQWARPLAETDERRFSAVMQELLAFAAGSLSQGRRLADAVETEDFMKLRERILHV